MSLAAMKADTAVIFLAALYLLRVKKLDAVLVMVISGVLEILLSAVVNFL